MYCLQCGNTFNLSNYIAWGVIFKYNDRGKSDVTVALYDVDLRD